MYQNPTLVQALVQERVAELRQSAEAVGRRRRRAHAHRLIELARHGTGWLLIDMGLRLAVPRGALSRSVARGQGS